MIKYTFIVEGMMCGMCEAHVNDAVGKFAGVKKVTSMHGKNQTVVISEKEIDVEKVKEAISAQGYKVGEVKQEPYEKKGLFSFFKG